MTLWLKEQCWVQPTVEVGLQGLPNMHGFKKLKLTKTQTHDLMVEGARRAMLD